MDSSDSTFAFIDDESRVYPKAAHTVIIPGFIGSVYDGLLATLRPSRWDFRACRAFLPWQAWGGRNVGLSEISLREFNELGLLLRPHPADHDA